MCKKNLFCAVFLLCFGTLLGAQSTCAQTFEREGIYLRQEYWKGLAFVKNGNSRAVGFAYRNLAPELEKSPALPLFKKSQRNSKVSAGIGIAVLLGALSSILLAENQLDKNGYIVNERKFRQGVSMLVGFTSIGASATIVFHIKSRRQLDDAVWLRNRALFQQ